MGRIYRFRTALSRHHRSAGFGIHSPFAFNFVCNVLGERLPYYSYERIDALRQHVIDATRHHLRHPRVISRKNAKMLFRIVNYFNPRHIVQFGTRYGISATCMLLPASSSRLYLYEPQLGEHPVVIDVLKPYSDRIEHSGSASAVIAHYQAARGKEERHFALVNDIPDESDYETIEHFLYSVIESEGVIIMRNLSKDKRLWQLWQDCERHAQRGQSFTNEKIGIIVATAKLPLENFYLWF